MKTKPITSLLISTTLVLMNTIAVYGKEIFVPSGIKLGAFTLSPLVEVELEYDTNIFKTTFNEKDDFIFHIKPSINLRSNWSRHAIELTLRSDHSFYTTYSDENTDDVFVTLSGRLDVLRDSFATSKFYWSQTHEDRGSPESGAIDEPTEFTTIGGFLGYEHQFNRLGVKVSNDISHIDFQDGKSIFEGLPPVEDSLRNRYENKSVIQLSYEATPRLTGFVRGQYNLIDYDSDIDRSGFNRDSTGFEINGGLTMNFTDLLYGDIYAGYLQQDYDDSRLDSIDGLSGGLNLKWHPTRLTTISMNVDRSIRETIQTGASGYLATVYKISVDHELLRYLLLNFNAGYTINEYEGQPDAFSSEREDETFILGAEAKYLFNKNFYFKALYLYQQRESNVPFNDHDSHRVFLGIATQY